MVQRAFGCVILLVVGVWAPRPVGAEFLCKTFGRCLYEGTAFRFTVVDKETNQPLADVHALAEWILHGRHGRNGPLMVQDAVSGLDGVISFPAWGPIPGPRLGLILNHDPVITLFKPGYVLHKPGGGMRAIFNAYPEGTEETTRVRRFGQDGHTFAMEPFRGTVEEWVNALRETASYGVPKGRMSDEEYRAFRVPYLARAQRVWKERDALPRKYHEPAQFLSHLERYVKMLEGGGR